MVTKPKCEDCLYYEVFRTFSEHTEGSCHRLPQDFDIGSEGWCGEHQVEGKRRTFDYAKSVQIIE